MHWACWWINHMPFIRLLPFNPSPNEINAFNTCCTELSEKTWKKKWLNIRDVIMSSMTSQITCVSIVCSMVCLGADQRKHESFTSLAFVRGNPPVDYPHKGPVTRKMFPLDDVIMTEKVHIEILPLARHGPVNPAQWCPWLKMSWLHKDLRHQQAWYWSSVPEYSNFSASRFKMNILISSMILFCRIVSLNGDVRQMKWSLWEWCSMFLFFVSNITVSDNMPCLTPWRIHLFDKKPHVLSIKLWISDNNFVATGRWDNAIFS